MYFNVLHNFQVWWDLLQQIHALWMVARYTCSIPYALFPVALSNGFLFVWVHSAAAHVYNHEPVLDGQTDYKGCSCWVLLGNRAQTWHVALRWNFWKNLFKNMTWERLPEPIPDILRVSDCSTHIIIYIYMTNEKRFLQLPAHRGKGNLLGLSTCA